MDAGKFNALQRHLPLAASTLLPVLALLLAFCFSPWFIRLEESVGLPWLFHWRGPQTPPDSVVIVAMDADAAARMALPAKTDRWPRSVHARLVQALHRRGAALIAFDIAFKEARSEAEDRTLAAAIRQAGNVVLFKYLQRPQYTVAPPENDTQATSPTIAILDIESEIPPAALIAEHAASVASFTLPKYPLSVHRAELYNELSEGIESTFPLAALQIYMRDSLKDFVPLLQNEIQSNTAEKRSPPTAQQLAREIHHSFSRHPPLAADIIRQLKQPAASRQMLSAVGERDRLITLAYAFSQLEPVYINYYGPAGTLTTIAYDKLIGADAGSSTLPNLHGKAVFVGLAEQQQTEQRDVYHTVFTRENGVDISGVEICATIFANLLDRNLIKPLPATLLYLLLSLWCITLYALLVFLPVKWALLLQLIVGSVYAGTAGYWFNRFNLWLPLATPLGLYMFANTAALAARYRHSRHMQRRITEALGHYLPQDAAQQLSHDFEHFYQQRRVVKGVCLLSDIQGYTEVSERLLPHQLHRIMNRYYEHLLEKVRAHRGTVGNIVGDSLLAFWPAETLHRDLVERACHTALAISRTFGRTLIEGVSLPTSIGIHGGSFSLGNLGAIDHYEYSPVGDIVNTTARLEALNRQLGTKILLTETLVCTITGFIIRYLGRFEVKNKREPVVVYELIGLVSEADASTGSLLSAFADALALYETGALQQALAAFEALLTAFPHDGPSRYYRQACLAKSRQQKGISIQGSEA